MSAALKRSTVLLFKPRNVDALISFAAYRWNSQWWSNVPMGPPDVILGITEAFKRDTDPKKVNLGVGAYRDDAGKPWVLPSVIEAEKIIASKKFNHEYAPIGGESTYTDAVARLAFGDDCPVFSDKSMASVQTLSGTGALRLGLEFITKHYAQKKLVYLPKPTWGNHPQICNTIGLEHKFYSYYDPKTVGFDLDGAIKDINQMPEGSIIMLHACAHNPTGVDPKPDQWARLSEVIMKRKLFPFFDMAYQGFATGDVDNDAAALRMFVKHGHQVLLCQSFAKNMGLYGERIGALHIMCGDKDTADKMMSQLKILIRVMYSNPPLYGSRIVTEILTNQKLRAMWLQDVKKMADRIISMRKALRAGIEGLGNKNKWDHITDQIGMFTFTGLKPDQVDRLTKEFHIYLTKDGRISMAGLSAQNVDHVAKGIHTVSS